MALNSVDVAIGRELLALRLAKGVPVDACAKAAGVSGEEFDLLETGEERIGAAQVFALAKLLGAPMASFFSSVEV